VGKLIPILFATLDWLKPPLLASCTNFHKTIPLGHPKRLPCDLARDCPFLFLLENGLCHFLCGSYYNDYRETTLSFGALLRLFDAKG
jgi:hypothetical protein